MNENNAAQPVLTDELINRLAHESGLDDGRGCAQFCAEQFARAIESALLSKLRAPVADEHQLNAAVEAIQFALSADEGMEWLRCWNEGDFEACRREWPETPEACFIGADPLHPGTKPLAALASAPVAGEAQKPVAWLHQCRKKPELTQLTMKKREPALAAKGYMPIPLYAAPQASEAVHGQHAGDVVAVLAYRSKGRPGAHGQTLGANGAGEFAVVYRGDEFAALVKANEEIRALESTGHHLDFAAIIHGEGYSGPMLRQEYVTRAALSAQPGAQTKEDDS